MVSLFSTYKKEGSTMKLFPLGLAISVVLYTVCAQCPWSRELVDLHADCICAYNSVQRLSVQCSPVNFTRLLTALQQTVQNIPIDLLYVNNATVTSLSDGTFRNLDIQSLHLAYSKITNISIKAFEGLERSLTSLNLEGNLLIQVPVDQIKRLTSLKQLDLSNNRISVIPDGAFQTLQLVTLKLTDNEFYVSKEAFRGLEGTLKNLNLRDNGLELLPPAIKNLEALAFLDLGQNKISRLESRFFEKMFSLTAINLERNIISKVESAAFHGINVSLSSLSLLSNHIEEFPSDLLSILTELRVLDLGFNKIQELPLDAFNHVPYLTLLALDGNPLETIPLAAFKHLNSTLRGLSIGGFYLKCDCRIRWVAQWIQKYDLQVTSRERNPQFCGEPESLRRRKFTQINPNEFVCDNKTLITTILLPTETNTVPSEAPKFTSLVGQTSNKGSKKLPGFPVSVQDADRSSTAKDGRSAGIISLSFEKTSTMPSTFPTADEITTSLTSSSPNLAQGDIDILDAYRKGSSAVIEWNPKSSSSSRVRVVHRYFGEKEFQYSPLLEYGQRRFVVSDLLEDSCIVICVTTTESISNLSEDLIPSSQCREIKNNPYRAAELDKIVIAAAAAVSGVILVAVIVFACCFCRRKKAKPVLPPPPPAIIPAVKSDHEWETVSMYSGRSIPRARIYNVDPTVHINGSYNHNFVMDDARSHMSQFSHMPNAYPKIRPTADGQSHHSYSQFSTKYGNGHSLGRPEIRKSQQSLSQLSGHHSYMGSHLSASPPKRKKTRKDYHRVNRLASASSVHSLTEYESDGNSRPDNHGADPYVDKNNVIPTHTNHRKDFGAR
ncbi:uncharacterized protein LOC143229009 isoform X1 [Tachypleus tridentatus]|uniref:uncharacterized protein LOC143229009 isoform X1 n=2 Tax=Tachypleus tridentatus TaxID=6853 RepID=UPI003FD37F98